MVGVKTKKCVRPDSCEEFLTLQSSTCYTYDISQNVNYSPGSFLHGY